MNAKLFIAILTLILAAKTSRAQNQEATDSLTREFKEVVVTAKQPATKLVGSTLVSTISRHKSCRPRHCPRRARTASMLKVQDDAVGVIGSKSNIEILSTPAPCVTWVLQQILFINLKRSGIAYGAGERHMKALTGAVLTKHNFQGVTYRPIQPHRRPDGRS